MGQRQVKPQEQEQTIVTPGPHVSVGKYASAEDASSAGARTKVATDLQLLAIAEREATATATFSASSDLVGADQPAAKRHMLEFVGNKVSQVTVTFA